MGRDWEAVSQAIKTRLEELAMTQAELSQRSGVALETVRELQHHLRVRRRSPRTLAALSQALGWPDGHLEAISHTQNPDDPDARDPVLAELDSIKHQLTAVTDRLDAIERRLAADDE